jgi:AcrR family transcriptional regulator/DNA-binding MarR family transcriptional regulator
VSRRTFYELFGDIDACLQAAMREAAARVRSRVLEACDPAANWRERLRGGLVVLLAFLDEQPPLARLLLSDPSAAGAGGDASDARERLLAAAVAAVDAGRAERAADRPARAAARRSGGGSRRARVPDADGLAPPPLTAEALVLGAAGLLRARAARDPPEPLLPLAGELMSLLVLPYLGPAAAAAELTVAVEPPAARSAPAADPLQGLGMRLTYRTVRVLLAVAAEPGASNRVAGRLAGVEDQGQISKLLRRLERLGLVENAGGPSGPGGRAAANAWTLTAKGRDLHDTLLSAPG